MDCKQPRDIEGLWLSIGSFQILLFRTNTVSLQEPTKAKTGFLFLRPRAKGVLLHLDLFDTDDNVSVHQPLKVITQRLVQEDPVICFTNNTNNIFLVVNTLDANQPRPRATPTYKHKQKHFITVLSNKKNWAIAKWYPARGQNAKVKHKLLAASTLKGAPLLSKISQVNSNAAISMRGDQKRRHLKNALPIRLEIHEMRDDFVFLY